MEKKKYNYVIEFWRFIFCILVVTLHSHRFMPIEKISPFAGWYIAVEFFFILSGYFMMKKIENTPKDNIFGNEAKFTLTYTIKKIKKLFPYVIISVLTFYLIRLVEKGQVIAFKNSIYELLLLTMAGFNKYLCVTPIWYIGSLSFGIMILMYIALKNKDFFKHIFIYLVPIFLYGAFARTYGELDIWSKTINNFFLVGNLRAIAGLSTGCLCYVFSNKLSKIDFTPLAKIILTFLELFGFLGVIIGSFIIPHSYNDFLFVLLLFLSISISMSKSSYTDKINNKERPILKFLGTVSMPIYITHWIPRSVVPRLLKNCTYFEINLFYIIGSFIFGCIFYFIVEFAKKHKGKILSIFVSNKQK